MCGIIGALTTQEGKIDRKSIEMMVQALAHRGPDHEGIFIEPKIGLGHRRLSIIDLSQEANQPFISEKKSHIIVYNGEIYNYRELRTELIKLGYTFRTQSDTEVVLYAFVAWGESCTLKFNGMFAFAIWDKKNEKLFLARDRYGIKPLYYAFHGGTFFFASEQKAIIKHETISVELDLETLPEYFTFQNIFSNKTFIKGIKLFPSGSYIYLDGNNFSNNFEPTIYWDYHFIQPANKNTEEEYIEELDRLFKQSVKRQLISDVELGSYLSGGMDSGAITSIASNNIEYLKTFTCGFDLQSASGLELAFDEREKSEYMSYLFKTEHYEMVLKSGDMERVLPALALALEEPRVGQSYPNYYVAQLASKFVKVVLAGTGGDELFGGYPWRYYRAVVNENFDSYIDKYYSFWQRLIPENTMETVFSPIGADIKDINTLEIFKSVFYDHADELTRPEDYINHSLYFEAKTFLHGLLNVEDKLSMAHGLEVRVPFLDNDLVDFAMQLPANLKLGNLGEVIRMNENETGPKSSKYYNKTKDGKLILRRMMSRYIPSDITDGVKQGFSAPDASWFKGESIEYVRRLLFNNNARIYNYMDRKCIQDLIGEHINGKANRRLLIWSLLNFELWCHAYL